LAGFNSRALCAIFVAMKAAAGTVEIVGRDDALHRVRQSVRQSAEEGRLLR